MDCLPSSHSSLDCVPDGLILKMMTYCGHEAARWMGTNRRFAKIGMNRFLWQRQCEIQMPYPSDAHTFILQAGPHPGCLPWQPWQRLYGLRHSAKYPTVSLLRTFGGVSRFEKVLFTTTKIFIGTYDSNKLLIWPIAGESLVKKAHTRAITCLIELPRKRFATASEDKRAIIWSDSGDQMNVLRGHSDPIRCMIALSNFIATGSDDHTVRLWLDNGTPGLVFYYYPSGITCMTVLNHPDFDFATGYADGTVRWMSLSGNRARELTCHNASVTAIFSLPQGGMVTTGKDRRRCFWSSKGEETNLFRGGFVADHRHISVLKNGDILMDYESHLHLVSPCGPHLKQLTSESPPIYHVALPTGGCLTMGRGCMNYWTNAGHLQHSRVGPGVPEHLQVSPSGHVLWVNGRNINILSPSENSGVFDMPNPHLATLTSLASSK
jgi:WD40 repeat protein